MRYYYFHIAFNCCRISCILFICSSNDGHIVILIPIHPWIALKSIWPYDHVISLTCAGLLWHLTIEHFAKQYLMSASELIISSKLACYSCLSSSLWILQILLFETLSLPSDISVLFLHSSLLLRKFAHLFLYLFGCWDFCDIHFFQLSYFMPFDS